MRTFVDTNILIYAHDIDAGRKQDIAKAALRDLWTERTGVLSTQVLQEFYVQATRASRGDRLSHDQAVLLIESFRLRFPVQDITVPLLHAALATAARFRISYRDAAIVEAARLRACAIVLSEDLAHDQDFAGVRVHDPFRAPRRGRRARQS